MILHCARKMRQMDRTVLCLFSILLIIVFCQEIEGRPQQTRPGCWYEGKRYQEGQVVNTTEPCLRCRCNDGSLRCRLRVCPKLPSPTPQGCTSRIPRENACCAELVCGDSSNERNVTARRDSAADTRRQEAEGCLHEGVRYGPGSAMMGSRRCEYCYCISGSRRCLRPRCLLPLPGCTPLYSPYSCCPVAYNCKNSVHNSYSSLGSSSSSVSRNGCRVGDRSYVEGEMVRDTGLKGTCDNCFCAMGGVRCVPLACAPPLQGCTPIVREGHCCPSTYNCSGSIEVKAAQNYASYAFISKDYAKFRKETNIPSMDLEENNQSRWNFTFEGRSHKNELRSESKTIAKTATSSTTKKTNERQTWTSRPDMDVTLRVEKLTRENATTNTTISSRENEMMNNEIPTERMESEKTWALQQETTFPVGSTTNEITEFPTTLETMTNLEITTSSEDYDHFTDSNIPTDFTTETWSLLETTTLRINEETSMDSSTMNNDETATTLMPEVTIRPKNNEEKPSSHRIIESTTKFLKITDPSRENDQPEATMKRFAETTSVSSTKSGTVTASPSTVHMPENMFVINVTLRTNVSVGHVQGVTMNPERSVPPDIEAILNITNRKKGDDYDYDYSQPTLPPSLPNVRIIPFVAADALVKTMENVPSQVTNYPLGSVGLSPQDLRPTVASGTSDNFYDIVTQKNRFSPPIETEGGFVPREPPYYDPPYRSTDHNLEIHGGVTVVQADITNSHRKNDELAGICVFENRKYHHGDILPSSGHCIICICYYGDVACSDEKCSPLKIGCRRQENEKICCGKIICVDANESPTVVLERADTIVSLPRDPLPSIDGIESPDPFRDVIKTKPAPDLPSLIEDMIPYYVEHRITKPSIPTTPPMISAHHKSNVPEHFDPIEHKFSPESTNNGINVDSRVTWGSSEITKNRVNETVTTRTSLIDDRAELTTPKTTTRLPIVDQTTFIQSTGSSSSSSMDQTEYHDEESPIFSFGSVFDMLFAENTETTTKSSMIVGGSAHKLSTDISTSIPVTPFDISPKNPSNLPSKVLFEDSAETTPRISADPSRMKPEIDESLDQSLKSLTTIDGRLLTTTDKSVTPMIEAERTTGSNRLSGDPRITTMSSDNEIATSVSGLLKLAGCNIYGKMYRVGRIITELSSPCLECRCTEVGVQCKQLEC